MKTKDSEKQAMMVFAVEHTEELCTLLNESQKTQEPTVVGMALKVAMCHQNVRKQVSFLLLFCSSLLLGILRPKV